MLLSEAISKLQNFQDLCGDCEFITPMNNHGCSFERYEPAFLEAITVEKHPAGGYIEYLGNGNPLVLVKVF